MARLVRATWHQWAVPRPPSRANGHWISWFSAPQGMELQKSDAGAPLMRGDEVVGFLGIAGADGGDAEDIANVHQWVKQLTQQG